MANCNENPIYVFPEKELRAASVPISTSIGLWAIYIFPGSVPIFSCSRIGRPIVGIYKSLTMDVEIWKYDISYPGKFVSNFRYCVFAVQMMPYQNLWKSFSWPRRQSSFQSDCWQGSPTRFCVSVRIGSHLPYLIHLYWQPPFPLSWSFFSLHFTYERVRWVAPQMTTTKKAWSSLFNLIPWLKWTRHLN